MISIIVAIDEKNGIGKNNDLLFRIPADHQRVRTFTKGHPLVMGRKTFESLGRLLPNRSHVVITRNPSSLKKLSYQPEIVVSSLEEGLEKAKEIEAKRHSGEDEGRLQNPDSGQARMTDDDEEVFIFGGGQIFKEAVEKGLVDRLYLTIVKGDFGADTFFPDYSMFKTVLKKEEHESDGYTYTFLDLEK